MGRGGEREWVRGLRECERKKGVRNRGEDGVKTGGRKEFFEGIAGGWRVWGGGVAVVGAGPVPVVAGFNQ